MCVSFRMYRTCPPDTGEVSLNGEKCFLFLLWEVIVNVSGLSSNHLTNHRTIHCWVFSTSLNICFM